MTPAQGAAQLEIEVTKIVFEVNQRAEANATRGLNIMRNTALEVLGHDGTGRRYGKHIASAPGEPPAPDKGNLRDKWHEQTLAAPNGKGNGIRVTMRMKSKMFYQKFLEFGTRRMAPRPHVKRIEDKARPPIEALFANI